MLPHRKAAAAALAAVPLALGTPWRAAPTPATAREVDAENLAAAISSGALPVRLTADGGSTRP